MPSVQQGTAVIRTGFRACCPCAPPLSLAFTNSSSPTLGGMLAFLPSIKTAVPQQQRDCQQNQQAWGGTGDIHIGLYDHLDKEQRKLETRDRIRMATTLTTEWFLGNAFGNGPSPAGSTVVDMGSGFGSTARVAAKEYGCNVRGVSLPVSSHRGGGGGGCVGDVGVGSWGGCSWVQARMRTDVA